MLNIQLMVVRSPPHSSSFSECAKKKAYNQKIQFVQTIIQDIDTIGKSHEVEFLCKSKKCWLTKEHKGPKATLVDSIFVEESKEDKVVEEHFV